MSEVKWIKLSTGMFDDEKIRLIESMPDADTMLVIWIKLLSQAGKTNASGYIFLSQNIPYTDEMLATLFNRPVSTVRLALETFKQFGMIEVDEDRFISISNWEKHQNVAGLEKIRAQTKKRVEKHREKKRLGVSDQDAETSGSEQERYRNVTVTESNATDIELDIELDIDRERDIVASAPAHLYREIVNYLNDKAGTRYRSSGKKTQTLIKARCKEGFTFEDFAQVIDSKVSDWKNDANMSKYLRPETLFGTKFEGYLNEKPKGAGQSGPHANSNAAFARTLDENGNPIEYNFGQGE